jgi:hypothetical protein
VRHEAAWWDAERTFNPVHRPDPAALLAGVDFVLIPHDYLAFDTPEVMWAAYGPTVTRDFTVVGHSAFWDLWARKNCRARGLC